MRHLIAGRSLSRLGVGLLAVTVCVLATACGSSGSSSGGSEGPVTIKLGTPLDNAEEVPVWYGIEKGIFKKHGLDLSTVALGGSTVVNTALASGSVDVALNDGITHILAVEKQIPVISVAQYSLSTPSELIANKDWAAKHDLTAKSPLTDIIHALVGARVGAASPVITAHENVLLKSEGVDPKSVKQVTVSSAPAEKNLLIAGKLDAFVAGPPLPNQMEAAGQGVILVNEGTQSAWSNSGVNLALVAKKSYAKDHPDVIKKLIRAINESVAALLKNPDDTVAAAQKHLPGTTKQALLYTYPLEGYSPCPTQSDKVWSENISTGLLAGELTKDSRADEGRVWTNEYIDIRC